MITQETRRAAYDKILPKVPTRALTILSVLSDGREMTAREIMNELGYTDPNKVRPRLTELRASELISVVDKRYDPESGVNVAVYRAVL